MNTQEVRKLFVEENGRFDLVGDYPTCAVDSGVDRYLNRGQYLLDRLVTPHGRKERRLFNLTVGQKSIEILHVVRIERVFTVTDEYGVMELEFLPDFIHLVKNVEGTEDNGVPLHWGLNVSLSDQEDLSSFKGVTGVEEAGDGLGKSVLLVSPAPSEGVTLQVIGRFKSVPLVIDKESYWTLDQNAAAILAAGRYYLMQSLASGTGTREALENVLVEVRQLISDQIELENLDHVEYI